MGLDLTVLEEEGGVPVQRTDGGGKAWADASTSQGGQGGPVRPRGSKRRGELLPRDPRREHTRARAVTSDLCPPELCMNKFWLFEAFSVWSFVTS